jgi:hypothetical protein
MKGVVVCSQPRAAEVDKFETCTAHQKYLQMIQALIV